MRGIAIREQLTNEWEKRGVKEEKEYAYITLAANELADTGKYKSKIPGMIGKIQNVAEGKVEKGGYCRKKAYGYSWKFPEN